MGGRGASSGVNPKQITLDRILLIKEIAEIRDVADKIRVSIDGIETSSGGAPIVPKKQCFCCEEFSLPALSEYEKCEICGWIDDPYQNKHPDSLNGKNSITLNKAREQYRNT